MRWRLSLLVRRLGNMQGQVLIMVAVSSLVLTGFVALSTDIGHYMTERQRLQNALDAGALAGAQFLPADGTKAELKARDFVEKNDMIDRSTVRVKFGCLVDYDANTDQADLDQVRGLCPQFKDELRSFSCLGNGKCFQNTCKADADGKRCNTIRVQAKKTVELFLAPVISQVVNIDANLESIACRGGCGPPPDIKMVLGLDNSSSMLGDKLEQAKDGAASILEGDFLVKGIHQVALATPNNSVGQTEFTDEYLELADQMRNLSLGVGTNFAQLFQRAITRFGDGTSEGIRKQIILLTDGRPTTPAGPCTAAKVQATLAKEQKDIRIFVIHYNSQQEFCNASGDDGESAENFLAGLAGSDTRVSEANFDRNECEDENSDQDDYYCQTDGESLREIFEIIVTQILNDVGPGSRLVDLSGFLR